MKRMLAVILSVFVLAACGPATQTPDTPVKSNPPTQGPPPSYAPRAGDDLLLRGEVFIDAADSLSMHSLPPQYSLTLRGSLPTPCHELRVAYAEPDSDNRINLDTYSVADPDVVCVQVLTPFEQDVYLGSFPAGHYTVWVNGVQVAEFDA